MAHKAHRAHATIIMVSIGQQRKRARPDRNWREAILRLEGAYSENTLRSYRADFAAFEAWCRTSRLRPLPASPDAVARFVAHEAPRLASTTLRRRLAGIRKVHRLMRLPNPSFASLRLCTPSATHRPAQSAASCRFSRRQSLPIGCSALAASGYAIDVARAELSLPLERV